MNVSSISRKFPGLLWWSVSLLDLLWFLTRFLPSLFPGRMQWSTLIFLYFLFLSFITVPLPHSFYFLTFSLSSCIISLLSHSFSSVICICSLNDLNLQEVLITALTFSSALPSCSLPSLHPSHEDMGNCVLCFPSFSSLLVWPLFSSNCCFILSSFASLYLGGLWENWAIRGDGSAVKAIVMQMEGQTSDTPNPHKYWVQWSSPSVNLV